MYQFSGSVQVGDAGTSEVQVVPLRHKKNFLYGGGGQTLEQVAHKSSGVSALGDSQTLTRYDPEQPAVYDLALGRRVGLDDLQKGLPISTALRF